MGWNSWDAYGFTINEADFKANAAVLAKFKQFGWQYAVIDEGWYMENPLGTNLAEQEVSAGRERDSDPGSEPLSHRRRTARASSRWPTGFTSKDSSSAFILCAEFRAQAVEENLPIAGYEFSCRRCRRHQLACPWDEGNWGIDDNAAGQAYYDSMLKLYAGWGLDYIKVDCISDHPYRPTEIKQIAAAIKKTGRPIVLSLSPGPTQLEHGGEVAEYAQMWRISDDHWDGWTFPHQRRRWRVALWRAG